MRFHGDMLRQRKFFILKLFIFKGHVFPRMAPEAQKLMRQYQSETNCLKPM